MMPSANTLVCAVIFLYNYCDTIIYPIVYDLIGFSNFIFAFLQPGLLLHCCFALMRSEPHTIGSHYMMYHLPSTGHGCDGSDPCLNAISSGNAFLTH